MSQLTSGEYVDRIARNNAPANERETRVPDNSSLAVPGLAVESPVSSTANTLADFAAAMGTAGQLAVKIGADIKANERERKQAEAIMEGEGVQAFQDHQAEILAGIENGSLKFGEGTSSEEAEAIALARVGKDNPAFARGYRDAAVPRIAAAIENARERGAKKNLALNLSSLQSKAINATDPKDIDAAFDAASTIPGSDPILGYENTVLSGMKLAASMGDRAAFDRFRGVAAEVGSAYFAGDIRVAESELKRVEMENAARGEREAINAVERSIYDNRPAESVRQQINYLLKLGRITAGTANNLAGQIDRQAAAVERKAEIAAVESAQLQAARAIGEEGGLGSIAQDPQIAIGDGSKHGLTRDPLIRATMESAFTEIALRHAPAYAAAQTPEDKAVVFERAEREKVMYAQKNGIMPDEWKSAIEAGVNSLSTFALTFKQDDKQDRPVPQAALRALELFNRIDPLWRQGLRSQIKDSAVDMLDMVAAFQSDPAIGGTDPDSTRRAFLQAVKVANDPARIPITQFERDRMATKVKKAVSEGWVFKSQPSNLGEIQGETMRRAELYARMGLSEDAAIARAIKVETAGGTNINGLWVSLRDASIGPDQIKPLKIGADKIIADYVKDHGEAFGLTHKDVSLQMRNNLWVLVDKNINGPVPVPASSSPHSFVYSTRELLGVAQGLTATQQTKHLEAIVKNSLDYRQHQDDPNFDNPLRSRVR